METPLPNWARSSEALALLAAIAIEKPEWSIRDHSHNLGGQVLSYSGRNAILLRKLHDKALEEATAEANLAHGCGVPWNEASAELMSLHAAEKPDALIDRLLQDAATEADLRFTMELQRSAAA